MPEVVFGFAGAERGNEASDGARQSRYGSLCELSQPGFEFAERHLDRVQVRRIGRQISKVRAAPFDRLSHAGDLVSRKVIHDDGLFALEGRSQTLFDIIKERLSVHRPIDDPRGRQSVVAQPGHERDCLPVPERHAADQALAARATPAQSRHLRVGRCLVDEHQPGRIKQALCADPAPAGLCDVRSILFGRAQCFF